MYRHTVASEMPRPAAISLDRSLPAQPQAVDLELEEVALALDEPDRPVDFRAKDRSLELIVRAWPRSADLRSLFERKRPLASIALLGPADRSTRKPRCAARWSRATWTASRRAPDRSSRCCGRPRAASPGGLSFSVSWEKQPRAIDCTHALDARPEDFPKARATHRGVVALQPLQELFRGRDHA
jgi:hypothetical protein